MSRLRVATVLAVVAVLAVLAGTAVAVSSYVGEDEEPAPPPAAREQLTVVDPATGSTVEVPAEDWRVEPADVRVYYADDQGRPTAVVRGPAVFRPGYCEQNPKDSNRAFVGFTQQGFAAWADELAGDGWTTGVDREPIELDDGTPAELTRVDAFIGTAGPCGSDGVEVAMVEAAGVRVVLVRDTGRADTLPSEDVRAILESLRVS